MYKLMQHHGRAELRQRDEEDYGQEEYDEYEEEAEEDQEDGVQEDPQPTREELEFLQLREKLKAQFRKNLKKETAGIVGYAGQSQDKRKTMNDKFGSFFGPSKPVISQRVLEESRSIRETRHIASSVPSSSSGNKKPPVSASVESRGGQHYRKPKAINEAKKKAQTLKDMRDYSFLLSDDADLPAPVKEQQSAPRNVPVRSSDTQSAHAPLKSKIQSNKPALASNGRILKSSVATNQPALASNGRNLKSSVATNRHTQGKAGSFKGTPVSSLKSTAAESGKALGGSVGNGPGQPLVRKALPSRGPQSTSTDRPLPKAMSDQNLKKKPSAIKPHSSTQNHYTEQKKISQGSEKVKSTLKQPLPSSRAQSCQLMKPSKQMPPRGIPENRLKKRPVGRDFDEDDPENIHMMIRQMFRYDPRKYVDDDNDDRDMEVGFDMIQKEEKRSSRIAKREDDEELRRIMEEEEEEEERARRRKKHRS